MADARMAMDTVSLTGVYAQFLHQGLVTPHTICLHDCSAARRDLNGFVKILKREALGVAVAVLDFREILAQKVLRNVTVVARRDVLMCRFHPTLELVSHDVAVDARLGIVRQIRRSFGIVERKGPHAEKSADSAGEYAAQESQWPIGIHGLQSYYSAGG
jgi:hypothetical protein